MSRMAAVGAERTAALLAAPILTVSGAELTGRDLVAAGAVSGRWPELEAGLALGLALSDARPPAGAEVEAAVRELRYARRLTSAQDFRDWLARRELGLADVRGAMERELARDGRRALAAEDPFDRDRALAALPAVGVCTGALRECGWWLADRLLATAPDGGAGATDDGRLRAVAATEAGLLALAGLEEPEDVRLARLARLLDADAAFAALAATAASDDAIARCLDAHMLDWLAFELEGLACPEPWVAAEALAQLRDDGIALRDVARAAGLEPQRRALMLDEAPPALRTALAAAALGDVVGPVEHQGAHEVWVVQRRTQPDAADPVLRARAADAVLAADTERRRAGRVAWHERD